VEQLYTLAHAERWQLEKGKFGDILLRTVAHHFRGANPSGSAVEAFCQSLHVEDLALASACAVGSEPAWEHFIREFRPVLYAAGRAIAGDSAGRELADSLYAELYGATPAATPEKRRSLFTYFHGRSKLSTWLRAVLAQRHVDALRAGRRTESLEDEETRGAAEIRGCSATHAPAVPPDPDRPRYIGLMQSALTAALDALDPRDRLRLSYYYVQELTLAQIGRLLGEHEATASRKLDRTRRDLRKQVERSLREASRLSDAQVELCFQYAVEEWHFDLPALRGDAGSGLRTPAESTGLRKSETDALSAPHTRDPGAPKR
jgi:RNA polymerase sigma-70 factor (ECF subfamily)